MDASALAVALLGRDDAAVSLRGVLRAAHCHAPHLVDAELGNVLRKRVRAGAITAVEGSALLGAAAVVIDVRHPHAGPLS